MAFWRGEQAYCLCLEPRFKHFWSWQDIMSFAAVSNKDILVVVLSFFYVFFVTLCIVEKLYVVTLVL